MKIVFAHDHIFFKDNDNIYSRGGLKSSAWERYLKVFNEVHVVARMKNINKDENNLKLTKSNRDGVYFHEISSISGAKNLIANYKKAYLELESVIKESDGVIARLPSEIGNLSISVAKKHNIPYAVEMVACAWDGLWNYGSLQGKVYAPISYFITKNKVKNSKFVSYVTDSFLQKRYPCKNYINSCSNVELQSIDNEDEIIKRRTLRINNNLNEEIKIGLIGSLTTKAKGIDIAIMAMKEVVKNNKNIKLHILGGGDKTYYNDMIKSQNLSSNVFLIGTLSSGEEVYKWLDSMDLYIQPSYQEGLPRATIEAMSRGCLCIGSNAGGIPELIDNKFIHKKGKYKELSNLIENYINNKNVKIDQANINIERSKRYKKAILENEREKFWGEFKNYIINEKSLNNDR